MTKAGQAPTALLVIDMQRQFTEPDGVFPVEGVDRIVADMLSFVDVARSHGAPVIWVEQSARPQVGLGRATLRYGRTDAHQGSGTQLDPRFVPQPEDIRMPKWRQSAFFMTDLDLCLRRLGIERVLICGITTNVCVTAAAKDASERDYETIVLGDLTASLPINEGGSQLMSAEQVQAAALAFIQYSYGDVCNFSEVTWAA
jgi:nicotinamidase-related amidase